MKNKILPAALFAVLLIVVAALGGNLIRRGREFARMTPTETQTTAAEAAPAVMPTQAPKTETMTEMTTETTTQPEETTTGGRGTYTGLFPLPTVHYTVPDPDNSRGLSTARIDHSFGVAKNGQPHDISVQTQKKFRDGGRRAIVYDPDATEKAIYLTFDCGFENGNTETLLNVLRDKGVPAAFFCTLYHIRQQPELVARMIREGHIVGNHSDTHPAFSSISRTQMARELEAVENELRTEFGYSSSYFRYPEGAYSENALDLVESLGFTPVFWSAAYADWDTSDPKGAQYAFDTVTARLHPGVVLLLHAVSPDNAAAMADIIDYARSEGYVFRSLDDYGK